MTDPDGNDIFMSGHRGPDLESFCPDSVRVPIFFGPKSVRIGGNPLFCPIIQRLSLGGLCMLVLPLSSSRYCTISTLGSSHVPRLCELNLFHVTVTQNLSL